MRPELLQNMYSVLQNMYSVLQNMYSVLYKNDTNVCKGWSQGSRPEVFQLRRLRLLRRLRPLRRLLCKRG